MILPMNSKDFELTMEQEFALVRYDQQIVNVVKVHAKGEYLMILPMNSKDFELTMEQEFALVRYDQQITEIPQEELRTALLEITRQLMIKNNLIRTLVKAGI